MTSPSALDAFMQAHSRMGVLLERLTAHHAEHLEVPPDEVHWGHAGSAGRACQALEEVLAFLGLSLD